VSGATTEVWSLPPRISIARHHRRPVKPSPDRFKSVVRVFPPLVPAVLFSALSRPIQDSPGFVAKMML
jgi:hypothetical protein